MQGKDNKSIITKNQTNKPVVHITCRVDLPIWWLETNFSCLKVFNIHNLSFSNWTPTAWFYAIASSLFNDSLINREWDYERSYTFITLYVNDCRLDWDSPSTLHNKKFKNGTFLRGGGRVHITSSIFIFLCRRLQYYKYMRLISLETIDNNVGPDH